VLSPAAVLVAKPSDLRTWLLLALVTTNLQLLLVFLLQSSRLLQLTWALDMLLPTVHSTHLHGLYMVLKDSFILWLQTTHHTTLPRIIQPTLAVTPVIMAATTLVLTQVAHLTQASTTIHLQDIKFRLTTILHLTSQLLTLSQLPPTLLRKLALQLQLQLVMFQLLRLPWSLSKHLHWM
jgi:hypothetical protein